VGYKSGVRLIAPVAVAGSAFAISFGVLARAAGMGSFAPSAMSATTFGGSAQFAAVSVLHDGGGAVTAIVASVLLNLRYLPIGVSVASGFTGGCAIWLTVLVVGAVTVAIKAIGPVVLARRELPRRLLDVVELLAPALLAALVVTEAVADKRHYVFDARLLGLGAVRRRDQAPCTASRDDRRGGAGGRGCPGRIVEAMGIAHWDEVKKRSRALGHLQGTWTFLGETAGCATVGVRRIEVTAGGWSTPAHEHGRDEEIFYVLAGRGISWQDGETFEIRAGDCVVYRADEVAHTVHALEDLDVLAFGNRHSDESVSFPRTGLSIVGARIVATEPGFRDGFPAQFHAEAAAGPPELPEPSPRPHTIVNLADVEAHRVEHGRVARDRRNLGRAAQSVRTGLQHVTVDPGRYSVAQHCHSAEEEIFVVLEGTGVLVLDEEETPIRPGHVIARPAATQVAHTFRAGDDGLTYLAYGTREPNDICWYPRSRKISWRGVGVIARVEPLDYWDGED
jgi:uncharacterized cupin superfamily protein